MYSFFYQNDLHANLLNGIYFTTNFCPTYILLIFYLNRQSISIKIDKGFPHLHIFKYKAILLIRKKSLRNDYNRVSISFLKRDSASIASFLSKIFFHRRH